MSGRNALLCFATATHHKFCTLEWILGAALISHYNWEVRWIVTKKKIRKRSFLQHPCLLQGYRSRLLETESSFMSSSVSLVASSGFSGFSFKEFSSCPSIALSDQKNINVRIMPDILNYETKKTMHAPTARMHLDFKFLSRLYIDSFYFLRTLWKKYFLFYFVFHFWFAQPFALKATHF